MRISRLGPGSILAILLAEFVVLLVLLLAYVLGWWNFDKLPSLIGDVVPLSVPWGGALGGVCIGIVGLTNHWSDYGDVLPSDQSRRWNAWYLVRLPIGSALGTVASLIVVLIIGTVGVDASGKPDLSTTGLAILFVLAFIVGYQQVVFHKLLSRTVAVVLGPGSGAGEGGGPTFATNSVLNFGSVTVNSERTLSLPLSNISQSTLSVPASAITIQGDSFTVARLPANIAAGNIGTLDIRFSPAEAKDYAGILTVVVGQTSRSVSLSGVGT